MTDIHRSITAAIKSISEKKNLIFKFDHNFSKAYDLRIDIKGNKVFLPNSLNLKEKIDIKIIEE